MLSCAEQVQMQKYKTHACETPKTACVQTTMLKHPTKQFRSVKKKLRNPQNAKIVSMYTQIIPTIQTSYVCLIIIIKKKKI